MLAAINCDEYFSIACLLRHVYYSALTWQSRELVPVRACCPKGTAGSVRGTCERPRATVREVRATHVYLSNLLCKIVSHGDTNA